MANRYVFTRRQNSILYFETFLTAGFLSFICLQMFKYHWVFSIITFIGLMAAFIYAFFEWRIMRYIITVFYSIVYGVLAFYFGRAVDKETFTAAVVLAFIAYFISLAAHKDHYDFLSKAKFVEYERHYH